MRDNNDTNYLHLNSDNRWPGFQQVGLDLRPEGAWQLATVPLLAGVSPAEIGDQPAPSGPAGVAVGPDGTVYCSRPEAHGVRKIDGCDDEDQPLLCLGGEGDHPTQLRHPRGLLYHPLRQALFVADSGNHRIQIFDPETLQLLEIWGQHGPGGEPEPRSTPGHFTEPWSLANDDRGNVYVVDYGNRRVQQFDLHGQVQPGFERNSKPHLRRPTGIAVMGEGEETRIYVLDARLGAVVILDANGLRKGEFGAAYLRNPLGLAATEGAVYVGENALRRLLTFKATAHDEYACVGAAVGYDGPVAAVAVAEKKGSLWLHPGGEMAPLPLLLGKAHAKSGVLWGGPFGNGGHPVQWHRLKAIPDTLEDGAHLQFFVHTSQDALQPPIAPTLGDSQPFDEHHWHPLPLDVLDALVDGKPATHLWLGAHFTGEGIQSPVLEQIRISYDHTTYREHLPAIYSRDSAQSLSEKARSDGLNRQNKTEIATKNEKVDACQTSSQVELLDRLLSLFESLFDDTERQISHLGRLFDPDATPASWLPWLASWLALDLDEGWSEAQQRGAIANAFTRYARRGTTAGLRESLRLFAGVDVHIEEPLVHAGWWSLPTSETATEPELQNALLGFTTMLVPVEADGAVLGTTAILDQVHLVTQNEFGAPLFENMAHQFTVQVHRGQVKDMDRIRTLIEAEKPAHTTYELCVIEPQMRVGFQARLGIDTIVTGPGPASRSGENAQGAVNVILGGQPPGQIGQRSRVGMTTWLGGAEQKSGTPDTCTQPFGSDGTAKRRQQNA